MSIQYLLFIRVVTIIGDIPQREACMQYISSVLDDAWYRIFKLVIVVASANYLVNVLCVNDALKIFKKVVDERLKTMYYIQVAYDRRFLKAKEQYTEQWLKHWMIAEFFKFSFEENVKKLQKTFKKSS